MSGQPPINPFVPGRGALPPFLAGRAAEQRELMRLLAYVRAGRGAPWDAVLSGPRGNGKTVLLRWFEREIETAGKVDVVWRTPSDLPSLDALATALVPPARFRSLLPDTLSVSIGIGRLGWELGGNPGTLTELLTLRCAHRPLVILLDEAHTLDETVGRALLNAGQSVAAAAPFLLVLAGTPGLTLHLDRMSATFWNRARHVGVGLLDEEAAAAALVRPFAEQSPAITFDEAALRRVLDESQCYPYFIQLWGAALWDAAAQHGRTVIAEAVVAREPGLRPRKEHVLRTPARRAGAAGPAPGRGFGRRCLRRTGDACPGHAECGHRQRPGPRLDPGNRAVPGPVGHGRSCLEAARCRRPVAAGHSEPDALRPSPVRAARVCAWTGIASSRARPEPFDGESGSIAIRRFDRSSARHFCRTTKKSMIASCLRRCRAGSATRAG